ncbi:MAG: hypothetical protein QOF35_2151 [Actinomycetota bacterium]|jgi:anti-sigma-K factor RskA|nr:hypothetical protein [Actinomycetota bacterium]
MSEIHGAVGSYVVNALDGEQLDEFEAHLAVCETCRREVVEFSETAAHLGSLVATTPPPALRASILSAIREMRPLPPESPPPTEDKSAPAGPLTSAGDAPHVLVDDKLTVRRQRRSARMLAFALAAALVAALGLGGWVVNLVQSQHAQVAESTLETQLLSAPDARIYTTKMSNGAPVSFVVSKTLDKALFIGKDIPATAPDKTYQLWTLRANGTVAIPDNIFTGGQTRKTWLGGNIQNASGVAVTIEPSGGSSKPTQAPVVSVNL